MGGAKSGAPGRPPRRSRRLAVAVTACLVLLAGAIVALAVALAAAQPAVVYVDNGLGSTVTLQVGSEDRGEVPPNAWKKLRLKPGTHRVVVRDIPGATVAEHELHVEAGRSYLYNPDNTVNYQVTQADYFERTLLRAVERQGGVAPPAPERLDRQVIRSVSGYDFVLVPFPLEIESLQGSQQTRRTRIARVE